MDCKPSDDCKEFIRGEIKKELIKESSQREEELKKETKQRLEFEEMVIDKFEVLETKVDESLRISKDNQETIKSLNIITIAKLDDIKDIKEDINEKVNIIGGKIEMVMEFMQNRGKFERLLSWIPKKYRGPSVLIALGGIVAFVLMYGPAVLELIKLRWGK